MRRKLRLRAVVLAAGRGDRLRPLSEWAPKPLLPVGGRPVVGYTLSQLASAGAEAIAVNLHYRGEEVRRRFGEKYQGVPLTYSPEKELLGTLGALLPLKEFLLEADLVVVINGDSLCRWPIRRLVRRHLRKGNSATLLVSKGADVREFGGGVEMNGSGHIVSFRPPMRSDAATRRRVFCGAQVFGPELLDRAGEAPSDLVQDLYQGILREGGRLGGLETARQWHDVGRPERYLRASLEWTRGRFPGRLFRRSWVSPGAEVATTAEVRRSAVEGGAKILGNASVQGTVLLPGAQVPQGCRVMDCIIGFDAVLPSGTAVERRMVTPTSTTAEPRAEDSVVSGLVFSPLRL